MTSVRDAKAELRAQVLRTRRAMTPEERLAAETALASSAQQLQPLMDARVVAAYVSVGSEPGTRPLLDALRASGKRVLLPLLLPDNDLDWADYRGADSLVPAGRGLVEPAGPRLGVDAVAKAQVVLVPGVAVDTRGVRLGRGGGSYDRVLSRLSVADTRPLLVVVLYAHEVLESVPREAHDHRVDAALTPDGVRQLER